MGHCDHDHDLTRLGQFLVVLAESSIPIEQSKGSLDNPTFRLHLERGLSHDATDNLQHPAERQHPRLERLATVASVCKQRRQPGESAAEMARHQPGTRSIRDIGGRDDDDEQQSEGIDG